MPKSNICERRVPVGTVVSQEVVTKIDDFAKSQGLPRAEALRSLIMGGLRNV